MKTSPDISDIEARAKSDPYNSVLHISLAKAYLEDGRDDKARTIIATKRKLPSKDPNIHYEWGKLCEELGMARQARESYEQAIALRPEEPEYHFRLAVLCQESGAWERALKHLQKTVAFSPLHDEAKKLLASLYKEMGLGGSADAVTQKKTQLHILPQTIPFMLTHEDVALLLDLFKGREKGYAEYQLFRTGTEGYVYRNDALGFSVVSEHIKGDKSIGVYLLRGDRTLRCCGIEFFIPGKKILVSLKDKGFLSILEDKIHHYAQTIKSKAKEFSIPGYVEDNGDRGRKIWFFLEDFIPYEMAERFLNTLLDRVAAPGLDFSVDLLLGYKPAGIGKTDHPVMLPLGVNLKTGKRCFFMDDEGVPYGDQLLFLKKIRRISRVEIQSFFKRPEREERKFAKISSNALLKVERRCAVLKAILTKARSGRTLRTEEKLILYFSVGFLPDGSLLLHNILEPCPDYRPNKVNRMIARLGSNPISCPKIRQLMPETTAYLPCNCSFNIPEGAYPSPVIHIDPAFTQTKIHLHNQRWTMNDKQGAGEEKQRALKEIETRYLLVCQKIEQLTREKERLEAMKRTMIDNHRPP